MRVDNYCPRPAAAGRAVTKAMRWIVALLLLGVCAGQCAAKAPSRQTAVSKSGPVAVRDYRSRHYLVHTDLDDAAAKELLGRLETMLRLVSKYWGRPQSGIVECYVAKNIDRWPRAILAQMDPQGISQIQDEAGVCIGMVSSAGNRFAAKSTVYAHARGGVAQHEAVHGYCQQTFGRTGPQWYAEGMAEQGQYWVEGEKGVTANPYVIEYLSKAPIKSLGELIVTDERIGGTWEDYAHWWSLAHLLDNNPNYSARFQQMGLAILMGHENSFELAFGPIAEQVAFEYKFFRQHLKPGLRCDLIRWDWNRKFTPLNTSARTIAANVLAQRGWQASGLTITPGQQYEYECTGKWKVTEDGDSLDADGMPDGKGKLLGILKRDAELSKPFPLGASGTLHLSATGDLYLRCQDEWTALDDNSGRQLVKFRVKKN